MPKPGDEIIVPGFTWVATANVVELAGAKVVFCGIDLASFNTCIDSLQDKITSNTVGILPVHLFGLCADLDPILEIASKRSLWIIEDAACALGSYYKEQHVGTLGNAGCFSLHPRKSISTGEGGMITTFNSELADQFCGLRNHGLVPGSATSSAAYSIAGFNYRMTDIQGSLGVAQMSRLEFLISERQRCANYYATALAEVSWLKHPATPTAMIHSWQSYVTLYSPDTPTMENVVHFNRGRNRVMEYLEENEISTRQGTHAPPHLDYYREKYQITKNDIPNSWLADS